MGKQSTESLNGIDSNAETIAMTPVDVDDLSYITAGVYESVGIGGGDKTVLCKALNIPDDTLEEDIILADIDMTGHGKIRAPLLLGNGSSWRTIWHSFHTKHPVRTSHTDEIRTFTITYWDKIKKSLNIEITESREMKEILKVSFTFTKKEASKTITMIKPAHKTKLFGTKSQRHVCLKCNYIWKNSLGRK